MNIVIPLRFAQNALCGLLAIGLSSSGLGSSVYFTPFENGAASSLQNFGSAGGTAIAVPSAVGNAPAPTLDNSQFQSRSWSLFCTPISASPAHAGSVLLPNSTTRFRMDSASSKMTISTWVRWNGVFGSNTQYGIATTLNPSQNTGWVLYIDNAGKIGYKLNILSSGQVYSRGRITTNPVVTSGQWAHVAITVDCSVSGNSAIAIYVNGVPQATTGSVLGSIVHVPSPGYEVAIGSLTHGIGTGGHSSLHGYLDDFQMWDRIQSAAKVRALVQARSVLPDHRGVAMDSLFSAFDSQGSVNVGDLTWSYAPTGLNVSGRTLGDIWRGPGGEHFAWLGGTAQSPSGMVGKPKRAVYAHYMASCPVGHSLYPWIVTTTSRDIDPLSSNLHSAMGAGHGGNINLPLYPQDGSSLTEAQTAELEIKRAIRAGFDGFAVDAWVAGNDAKMRIGELMAAAARLGVDFKITICVDSATHATPPDGVMTQTFADSINWLINTHGNSPHLARRHGKPLIFTYQTFNILKNHPLKAQPANPAWWADISNAWNQVRSLVSEPIFLHADIETMVERAIPYGPTADVAIAQWAGQHFEAVGGFVAPWTPAKSADYATAAKAGGAEWSQPICPNYYSRGGGFSVEAGTNKLRGGYETARNTGATLMQVATWNDYGEQTHVAPSYGGGYTVSRIHKYLADWWKAGSAPAVTQDEVHVIFRHTLEGPAPWPFGMRRPAYHDLNILEVATLLTASGTVSVPGYGTYQAPAGFHTRQFPLQVGAVSATVSRAGGTVASVTSPEKVSDKPFREDHTMVCASSNFASEWTSDFGAKPPLLYSEYGDIDSDGLPNWFEMYYFGDGVADPGEIGWRGDFPVMAQAAATDSRSAPGADPDADGFTNLQEFANQTDPRVADVAYPMGYVWNTSGIEARQLSLNGDYDTQRRMVWFYHFAHGPEQAIPQTGNYDFMSAAGNTSMQQNGPHTDPLGQTFGAGTQFGAYIGRRQVSGVWQTLFQPRENAAAILCWKSPVTGLVALSFNVVEVSSSAPPAYHQPFILDIKRNQETTTLATVSLLPGQTGTLTPLAIPVQKGDCVWLFGHSGGIYGGSRGYLTNIKVELLQNTGP